MLVVFRMPLALCATAPTRLNAREQYGLSEFEVRSDSAAQRPSRRTTRVRTDEVQRDTAPKLGDVLLCKAGISADDARLNALDAPLDAPQKPFVVNGGLRVATDHFPDRHTLTSLSWSLPSNRDWGP